MDLWVQDNCIQSEIYGAIASCTKGMRWLRWSSTWKTSASLLNSSIGPLPGIGFQDFSNSRRVQLCRPLTPKTQRLQRRSLCTIAEGCRGLMLNPGDIAICRAKLHLIPSLSFNIIWIISQRETNLAIRHQYSRVNSVLQLHQSWLSKAVNLDSERHVAQRFLEHVMDMLTDSIWMSYWTVCLLTTPVTTKPTSHAGTAPCITSTLSESPGVN